MSDERMAGRSTPSSNAVRAVVIVHADHAAVNARRSAAAARSRRPGFIYAARRCALCPDRGELGIMRARAHAKPDTRRRERVGQRIILTGNRSSAEEASDGAWSTRSSSLPDLMEATLATVRRIAATRQNFNPAGQAGDPPGDRHVDLRRPGLEIEAYNGMVPTSDRREGVNAFNEKRKPDSREMSTMTSASIFVKWAHGRPPAHREDADIGAEARMVPSRP